MESHATSELPFSCDPFWFPYAKLCVCGWIAFPLIRYSKALFLFLVFLLPFLDSFLYPICLKIVPQRIHLVSCSVQRIQVLLRFLLRSFSLDCFCDGHAQHLRHHPGIEEQGQVVVGFVDRQFQCLVPLVFKFREKISCVSEVSLLNWDTDQAVFSEARQAAELLQQFGGFFCRSCLFRSVWPCTIPVPALRPCVTNTAFSSPWHARPLLL